jgi:hypothetical protein
MSNSSLKYKSTRILTNAVFRLLIYNYTRPNSFKKPYYLLTESKAITFFTNPPYLILSTHRGQKHFPASLFKCQQQPLICFFKWTSAYLSQWLWSLHLDPMVTYFMSTSRWIFFFFLCFSFWLENLLQKKGKWHGKGVAVKTSRCQQGCHPSGRPPLSSGHVVWTFVSTSLLHFLQLAVFVNIF